MAGNYGPSGALFVNERKQAPNHPDYEGKLELDEELVSSLVQQLKAGETPMLDLKGWKKQGKKGPFLSLSPKLPWKPNGGTSSAPARSSSGSSDPF